jgi:hypothetical protein
MKMSEKTIDKLNCESIISQFSSLNEDEKKYMLSKVRLSLLLEVAYHLSNLYELNAKEDAERVRKMGEEICY